ncbi:tetratricopeptide repeat protein [Spirochaeta cellobiosiphila]|uniref:tetratricopeptide repeat protein n=1 Tax=Spirochaeta cellobiosiphila TaxID=504483 RepID=UPI0012EC62EF|nr:PEGA domain-containing protein [Spirochaeta cellobiosiphila]
MKRSLIMISYLWITVLLWGQTSSNDMANVFIVSEPQNAHIIVNNQAITQKTPALIKLPINSKHSLSLLKDDYKLLSIEFSVDKNNIVINKTLESNYIIVENPDSSKSQSSKYLKIPEGEYSIDRTNMDGFIQPQYPHKNQMLLMNIFSIPFYFVTTIAWFSQEELTPSRTTMALSGASLTLFLSNLILHKKRNDYERNFYSSIQEIDNESYNDQLEFDKGEIYLQQGLFIDAEKTYLDILQLNKDKSIYPIIFYKLAKLHLIMGKTDISEEELLLILTNYPHPDVYDKTLKTLADISIVKGNVSKGIEYLNKITYIDPIYSKEDIKNIIEALK